MLASVITAFLYAASGICGRRAALAVGSLRANAVRLTLAVLVLGCWLLFQGSPDYSERAVWWLFVSGAIGFGLGDVCLFLAYPRIGARLALLVNFCSAPLFGGVLEWMLHGTSFTLPQLGATCTILAGVGMALLAGHGMETRVATRWHEGTLGGFVAALMSGFGQGCGAALSRHAQAAAMADGMVMDGMTQAFVRMVPGALVSTVVWLVVARLRKEPRWAATVGTHAWKWVVAASMFGPVLGVSCFQTALSQQSSVLVLSITATAPVLIMPLSAVMDGDRPRRVAVFGGLVAVVGVVWLVQMGTR